MPDAVENAPRTAADHTFQVDLRGLVDLLSHHLYSSPRVYLRELLQNGVDAITARQAADPGAPAAIRLTAADGGLRVEDTGVGLTEADVHRFLATIGRSSKRDALETARREYLGQFGIGLLACFVVADEITVVTRSATAPDAPPVEWRAGADGRYTVRVLPDDARPEPGTTVLLAPRRGSEDWFAPDRVVELARDFGALLPYDITVTDAATGRTLPVTDTPAVWDRPFATPDARRAALSRYCDETLGFVPLDVIDLDVPLAGVRGAAFVLPSAVSPAMRGRHRVHLKGMLLTETADALLPDWAFFVRCAVDTEALRPTASRENLYDDEALAAVRDALGVRLRDWLTGLAASEPERLRDFLRVHHLGVKAMARHDDELLALMLPWLPFDTTDGQVGLEEFARRHAVIHLTDTVEEFRQIAPIAAAAGLGVVNGGYTYDADLVRRLPVLRPGTVVDRLDPDTVTAHLDSVDPSVELAAGPFLALARGVLEPLSCDASLRAFHPVTVPALLLDGRDERNERTRAQAESDATAAGDDLWAGILGSLRGGAPRARLVLNHLNPLVRRMTSVSDPGLARTGVEGLYGQALLMSRRPMTAAEGALLNRSFLGLLERALHEPATEDK
ncbi:HSP90 family protein [Yinghuangia seranimata]|uniref:HSP90 family protein n=1 Tax=Yinghuangia seranimata TaxID=408067 RepID=UPI00248C036A|nr:HSP90 family protein [Yinghuangia seranimata]MDI2132273.1 HSP90 family protein [Yinghuangia seranimata]